MKISNRGIELIKKYESCVLDAYKCPAGVWTIGWGHAVGVTPGMHISKEQADEYLKKDVAKYEQHVSSYSQYNWNQNQFDALVSFAYNVGSIKQLTSNGLRTITEIADRMLLYTKANGKTLSGLVKRRKEEHDLFVLNIVTEKKTVEELVQEVINGVWGNGTERKKALEKAGYDYKKVQAQVNKYYKKR